MLSLQLCSARIRMHVRSNWSNFSNGGARVQEGEVPFALKSHDNVVQWNSIMNHIKKIANYLTSKPMFSNECYNYYECNLKHYVNLTL